MRDSVVEPLGTLLGLAMAPVTAAVAAARRARVFHPRGSVYVARVHAAGHEEPWSSLGERLSGSALVRFSGALFKAPIGPDVLGCAIRFTHNDVPDAPPREDDQDLLLATILRPWTMGVSPFTTRFTDYLRNRYNAVSPFEAPGAGRTEWRVVPVDSDAASEATGNSRDERLLDAVRRGGVSLRLEATRYRSVPALVARRAFHEVARIDLLQKTDLGDDDLRFDPFRAGRGLEPRGFIHALRRGAYGGSQRARPRSPVSPPA